MSGNTVDGSAETVFTVGVPENTTQNTDREVTVSYFSVSCPCGCGESVTATDEGFTATTVTVEGCSTSGIRSAVVRKSWAYSHAVPVTALRHRDGLVVF